MEDAIWHEKAAPGTYPGMNVCSEMRRLTMHIKICL
jgi:hypothetical protein